MSTAPGRTPVAPPSGARGIFASFNVAPLRRAAEAGAKSAPVPWLEVRVAMALGGQALATMTGDIAAGRTAVAAARAAIAAAAMLVTAAVIARPCPDVGREVI